MPLNRVSFSGFLLWDGVSCSYSRLHDRVHIFHNQPRNVVAGHLHYVNVISILWIAAFPHSLLDFLQISRAVHNFLKKLKDRVLLKKTFLQDRGVIFRNLTGRQGTFQIFKRHFPVCS